MQANTETALRDALTAFETSVTSPVVSGELSDWIEKVKKSWSTVSTHITEQLHHFHPQQFQEISDADAALFRQVELLKAEDEAIQCDLEKLGQTMSRMAEHLPKLEPDEAKAQPHVQSLMDQSVALVARVRKQEVAVTDLVFRGVQSRTRWRGLRQSGYARCDFHVSAMPKTGRTFAAIGLPLTRLCRRTK